MQNFCIRHRYCEIKFLIRTTLFNMCGFISTTVVRARFILQITLYLLFGKFFSQETWIKLIVGFAKPHRKCSQTETVYIVSFSCKVETNSRPSWSEDTEELTVGTFRVWAKPQTFLFWHLRGLKADANRLLLCSRGHSLPLTWNPRIIFFSLSL